jgi:DNA-binding CsgD family transcriptional regulator
MPGLETTKKTRALSPSLSELPYSLAPHRRLLYIYRTSAERTGALLRATLTGIEQGEAVVPFANDRFLSLLKQTAETTGKQAEEQLRPVEAVDPSRGFDPGYLLGRVKQALQEAAEYGFPRSRLIVDTQLAYTLAGTEVDFLSFAGDLARATEGSEVSLTHVCFYEFLPRHALAEFLEMHTDVVLSPALGGAAEDADQSATPVGLVSAIRALYLSRAQILRRVLDPIITRDEVSEPVRLPSVTDYLREDFVLLDSELSVRYAGNLEDGNGREYELRDMLSAADYPRVREALSGKQHAEDNPIEITLAGDGAPESQVLRIHRLGVDEELVGYLCVFQSVPTETVADNSGDRRGGSENQVTEREHEIIRLLLSGMRNREIAETLKVAEITVKKHLGSIYRKLHVRNRVELIRLWEHE